MSARCRWRGPVMDDGCFGWTGPARPADVCVGRGASRRRPGPETERGHHPHSTVMQSQKAVTAYFSSKQLLPFGFHCFPNQRLDVDGSSNSDAGHLVALTDCPVLVAMAADAALALPADGSGTLPSEQCLFSREDHRKTPGVWSECELQCSYMVLLALPLQPHRPPSLGTRSIHEYTCIWTLLLMCTK